MTTTKTDTDRTSVDQDQGELLPLTPGLLASAMMRYDQGAFMTTRHGSYRIDLMRTIGAMYALAKYDLLGDTQVLEEFTGTGFYTPALESDYFGYLPKTKGLEELAQVLIAWCEACPTSQTAQ